MEETLLADRLQIHLNSAVSEEAATQQERLVVWVKFVVCSFFWLFISLFHFSVPRRTEGWFRSIRMLTQVPSKYWKRTTNYYFFMRTKWRKTENMKNKRTCNISNSMPCCNRYMEVLKVRSILVIGDCLLMCCWQREYLALKRSRNVANVYHRR